MDDAMKDKELLAKLEKLLERREDVVPEAEDEDTRTAIDFARKMASLGGNPSKEYTENLKARIIHQLAEQEKKSRSENIDLDYWGAARRRKWQGTLAALILVIVLAVILLVLLL
jgi:hypothetical protein